VTIKPGTTNTPSSGPLSFRAWGPLVGGGPCHGQTMTFRGTLDKGASCFTQVFRGRVEGLSGVSRFYGPGVLGQVQEFLYDAAGNVVGSDQPQVVTSSTNVDDPAFMHCGTSEGVTHLDFSSTVELYGGAQSDSARTGPSGGEQTFKGSCEFQGNVGFDPPLGALSRETTVTAKAPGNCSGSLTRASGRTVELDNAEARYSATSLGPQSCGLDPESTGSGHLTIQGARIDFHMSETRVGPEGRLTWTGNRGGSMSGTATGSGDPAAQASACAGSGLSHSGLTISGSSTSGISG
jgi:hypothetical protein